MPNGFLRIQVMSAFQSKGVNEAMIRVYKEVDHQIIHEFFTITNNMGVSPYLPLNAPDIALSLDSQNRIKPYETYNVEVRCNAYETLEIIGVQIFANQKTNLPLNLIPFESLDIKSNQRSVSTICDHQLLINNQGQGDHLYSSIARIQTNIKIPKRIIVHLGRPSSSAENLSVDFIDYLKNVACSEIYPTWETEAIKANVYCQISLALNRIYSEWYPSKGYPFDITNSIYYDQVFVKNRNIFESISNIVDEIFNEYIQKDNDSLPYYAEYCDGKSNHCSGLKQWGSQSLAKIGYHHLNILKYYYGENIQIVTTNDIQDIEYSYSGTPLKINMKGIDVKEIQNQLKLIETSYPLLNTASLSNGIYDYEMEHIITLFQEQFCLNVDGIIGKQTWYKIATIYRNIKYVNQLRNLLKNNNSTPNYMFLQPHDKNEQVRILQLYLNIISLYDMNIIDTTKIDTQFLNKTYISVLSFQRKYNLNRNGNVDITTWNKIVSVLNQFRNNLLQIDFMPMYPNIEYTIGMNHVSVLELQKALNNISSIYVEVPISIMDGIYSKTTIKAISTIQEIFNLEVSGFINEMTWNAIFKINNEIINGKALSLGLPQYPTTLMKDKEISKDTLLLKERLETIAKNYNVLPIIKQTGIYEEQWKKAISSFQTLLGFNPNGIIDENTWIKINELYQQLIQSKKGI